MMWRDDWRDPDPSPARQGWAPWLIVLVIIAHNATHAVIGRRVGCKVRVDQEELTA